MLKSSVLNWTAQFVQTAPKIFTETEIKSCRRLETHVHHFNLTPFKVLRPGFCFSVNIYFISLTLLWWFSLFCCPVICFSIKTNHNVPLIWSALTDFCQTAELKWKNIKFNCSYTSQRNICASAFSVFSLTLLDKRSVDDPDGAVQSARPHAARWLAGWWVLRGGRAQRLQPVEQEDEHSHHGDRCSDAGPDGEVKGREEGEDVDLFLGFS